jgi:glucosamine--fructose-6-phosphate aminotransferase (isomerizing)
MSNDDFFQEISAIPTRAHDTLHQPVQSLPLHVPYLGMGSSYFAPLAFKYMGIPIFPELASEYYCYLAKDEVSPMAVLLSQSGLSSEVLWCRELFEQYVAISNDIDSPLCTAPNVAHVVPIMAGTEQFSSSKTYINTLIKLFNGLGFSPMASVERIGREWERYRQTGEQLADAIFTILRQHPIHGIYITGSGPNIATAYEAALILSESTKLVFQGLPMAQYDHGPKETAEGSIVIQIMANGIAYERTKHLSKLIGQSGAYVLTVEELDVAEPYSILHTILPFNFMAYYLSRKLGITDTFLVGGKVTEVS